MTCWLQETDDQRPTVFLFFNISAYITSLIRLSTFSGSRKMRFHFCVKFEIIVYAQLATVYLSFSLRHQMRLRCGRRQLDRSRSRMDGRREQEDGREKQQEGNGPIDLRAIRTVFRETDYHLDIFFQAQL